MIRFMSGHSDFRKWKRVYADYYEEEKETEIDMQLNVKRET